MKMKKRVITHNLIEGYHCYPGAPKEVSFLSNRHRHIFVIRCAFEVIDSNREIEIFMQQKKIDEFIISNYGKPAEFYSLSCEMIAEIIINNFNNCVEVEVLEDGFGGAIIQR